MVVLLVILTVLACIGLEFYLGKRSVRERNTAEEALQGPVAAMPDLLPYGIACRLPGGVFLHGGHTWAHIELSGEVKIGMDAFARGILGRIDRIELPAWGQDVRQGEPAFTVLQGGKKIGLVSPVDGVVCAINDDVNLDPEGAESEPYQTGWILAVRPSNLIQNLKRLKVSASASAWLEKEMRELSEFLALYRPRPQGVGVTLPDGGIHAAGIIESMDGEILQLVIRRFLR
jgi:glycine cleavage system H lipoate-binding protein